MTPSERLDIAWKYFELCAKQRLSLFNFFVVFSGLLTTGYITAITDSRIPLWLPMSLGILQVLTSYIFYALDVRNKNLTKHAEEAIKEIEISTPLNPAQPRARFFSSEATMTLDLPGPIPKTIGSAFRWLYFIFVVFGVIELIFALSGCTVALDQAILRCIDLHKVMGAS